MSLNNYYNSDTDKFDLGYIDAFYDRLFSPKQSTSNKILEIGVCHGGSVRLWRDFFQNSLVYGVDIGNLDFLQNESRIVALGECDAYTSNTLLRLKELEPEGFDIIIDDGPHTLESMQFFLSNYVSLLKNNGILVLEDVIDTSWTQSLVNLLDSSVGNISVLNMPDKIKSESLRERWVNGLDVIILEKY